MDWLDDATSHSSAEGGDEQAGQQAGDDYPLVDLEQDIFTDEWKAGIEALDCLDEPQLYDTEDGFVPADWEHDQAAMNKPCKYSAWMNSDWPISKARKLYLWDRSVHTWDYHSRITNWSGTAAVSWS